MENQDKSISPEWLESKGFARIVKGKEEETFEMFPYVFEPEKLLHGGGDYIGFMEIKADRKRFCVLLDPLPNEGDGHYGFLIYIQDDYGCGFTLIPNQYSEMTEYHFSLLYEAIRRKKL